jgi:hypothetical protein
MQSFSEFFESKLKKPLLEYRHKDAFGGIKQSIHPDNKKGSNLTIDPSSRKIPWVKGPYKKERKHGETLIGDELNRELGSLNGVEFEDGKEIKRKNSNQILKLFTNAHGQPCGRIVEIKESVDTNTIFDADGHGGTPNQVDIDYFGFVLPMKISKFRKLVPSGAWNPKTKDFILKAIDNGEKIAPPFLVVKWDDNNKVWNVLDHEGRSRSDAVAQKYGDIEIPIHILPNGMRARNITTEMRNAPFTPQQI